MGLLQELWADRIAAAKDEANEGLVKQVKRGLRGWNKPGQFGDKSIGGDDSPAQLVKRVKGYDDKTLLSLKDSDKAPEGSPRALQNKVIDRELKRRGISGEDDECVSKQCHAQAARKSKEDDVVQHVNKSKKTGKLYVSDWHDKQETVATYKRGKLQEDANLQSIGKSLKLPKDYGKVVKPGKAMNTPQEVNHDDPDLKAAVAGLEKTEPAFKVGNIVKPLIGPHKGEPHEVVKVFDDGKLAIKPKDLDAKAVQYKSSTKQAKVDPKKVELAEDLKYENPKSFGRKLFNKMMGIPQGPYKYKVGDVVKYDMEPPQPGGHGEGKITKLLDGHHYLVDGKKVVNQFEIKKLVSKAVDEQTFSIFKKGSLLSQVTQKLLETKWEVLIEYGTNEDDVHTMQVEAATADEAVEKAQLWVERNDIVEARIGEPQRVEEAVAGPLQKFTKGQKVIVKKTGEEVEVMRQSEDGLVFTASKDALKVPNDKKLKIVPGKGYKEYMPRELDLKQ